MSLAAATGAECADANAGGANGGGESLARAKRGEVSVCEWIIAVVLWTEKAYA